MANFLYDLNPVQNIIADAIGEPGRRTFFLQARAGSQLVSIVMEKHDVGTLAVSVLQLLEELEKTHPVMASSSSRNKKPLRPEHPMDPIFRVGQLSIGYDEDEDKIWLIAKALMVNEENQLVDPSRDDVPGVRFVANREQMRAMSEHALEVIGQGRPICPLCNRPIDRNGHFCSRTDGQAMPIIF